MKNVKDCLKFKNGGITLIALVITIVILLILSGVSIGILVGENGILKQATKAKEETKKTSLEEQRQLAMLNAIANNENQTYTDKNGDNAIIPAGFSITGIEGEGVISDGLVIIDSEGNEFVWIPVEDTFQADEMTIADDEQNFVSSVNKYHGFYIGRYETGVEEGNLIESTNSNNLENWTGWQSIRENNKIPRAVVKKDKIVWNIITRKKAMEVSELFYSEKNIGVQSRLMSSNAYDAVFRFIEKYDNTDGSIWANYQISEINMTDFTETAQYSVDLGLTYMPISKNKEKGNQWILTTGATKNRDYTKNIDEVMGNMAECTTANNSEGYMILRGYNYKQGTDLAINRVRGANIKTVSSGNSFRIMLYIK